MTSLDKTDIIKEVYLLEQHRLESFESWPFDDSSSCSKLKMAEAGFYFSGSVVDPDTVTCFACNKTLDGWEATDEPWKEHARHAPQCIFVKYQRPENQITVRQFLEIFNTVIRNTINRKIAQLKAITQKKAENYLNNFTNKKH